MSNQLTNHRNLELDNLRAFAVIMVILHHVTLTFHGGNWWDTIVFRWLNGSGGVDLFLVISGFVISATFIPKLDAAIALGDSSPIKTTLVFYYRRIRRLCPAAFFWTLLIFVGNEALYRYGMGVPTHVAFEKLVASVLYVANFSELKSGSPFGYFWSLALEMQFYLAFPIFLFFVKSAFYRSIALASLFVLQTFWTPFGDSFWAFRFQGLLLGVLVYQLTQVKVYSSLVPNAASKAVRQLFAPAMVILILVALLPLKPYPLFGYSVVCLLSAVLVTAASYERGFVSAIFPAPITNWIGSRSYSLYLSHTPVMLLNRVAWMFVLSFFGKELDNSYWIGLLTTSTIMIIFMSELTYRYFEIPFLRQSPKRTSDLLTIPQMATS